MTTYFHNLDDGWLELVCRSCKAHLLVEVDEQVHMRQRNGKEPFFFCAVCAKTHKCKLTIIVE